MAFHFSASLPTNIVPAATHWTPNGGEREREVCGNRKDWKDMLGFHMQVPNAKPRNLNLIPRVLGSPRKHNK